MTSISGTSKKERSISAVFRFLKFFSSVRFGIYLLIALGVMSLAGMLIVQQNVTGFGTFYAELSPWQQSLFEWLGLFDIYHSWYYRLLLAALALNIILASIDTFPATWKLIREPNITLSPARFEAQTHFHDFLFGEGDPDRAIEIAEERLRRKGYRDIRKTSAGSARFVFAQKGSWDRLGAYAVHVCLLLILFGGFLTSWSARNGEMALAPGDEANRVATVEVDGEDRRRVTFEIPFTVRCNDIRQKLIDSQGSIRASNTLDWISDLTIIDGDIRRDVTVSLNSPVDYGGYRIFHSSVIPLGRARNLTITATAENGTSETISFTRDGSAVLKNGTRIDFVNFRAGFNMRTEDPDSDTSDYDAPAAVLAVTPPGGETQTAYAYGGILSMMPIDQNPVAGLTFRLERFEKVADKHVLFFRRDPGQPLIYTGFGVLAVTLIAVFLFSHKRIWFRADREGEGIRIRIAGDTNRPYDSFAASFEKTAAEVADALRKSG